ncbi:MAG: aldo/keto reductase [Chloroflexi bacterium]|nr:aldo/keto reductase [Chloroflexota bacterium]
MSAVDARTKLVTFSSGKQEDEMQQREYGKTGEMLSIIGFAGIVVSGVNSDQAADDVAWSIDQGINYFDVAPAYGNAQEMLGPALEPHRNGVFLACKTKYRDAKTARQDLENSLRLLRTDRFDLYQLHSMKSQEDLDEATSPGGVLEMVSKARDEGLVRHIGFSAHSSEVAVELMDRFHFDSVLFPVNWVNYFESGFGPRIMEKARQVGTARLALKGMASHQLEDPGHRVREKCWYHPLEDPELARLALRFTLSQPVTAAIPPGDPELFRATVEMGQEFTEITEAETDRLRQAAAGLPPLFELAHA